MRVFDSIVIVSGVSIIGGYFNAQYHYLPTTEDTGFFLI